MLANLSSNSISFATETPSFVILGAPKDLSRTTFLPLGPNVVLTALARIFTPATSLFLASSPNFTYFAVIFSSSIKYY